MGGFADGLLGCSSSGSQPSKHLLKWIGRLLPASINFYTDLDASENHLLASSKIDAQLNDIAIIDGPRLALNTRRTEPQMIQKSA
jgi:hypothetical protein